MKFQGNARIQIFNGGERRSDVWDPEILRCSYQTCASGTISDIRSLDQYEKNWMLLSGLNNKRVKKERRHGGRRGVKGAEKRVKEVMKISEIETEMPPFRWYLLLSVEGGGSV